MFRRVLVPALAVLLAAAPGFASPVVVRWPPWLSIESPVNPFDPSTRGAAFLVHAMVREGPVTAGDLTGSAEGLVHGARRSIAVQFDTTSQPGVFAVRRQWPHEGTWIVRITLRGQSSALVKLDSSGEVASAQVPTRIVSGNRLPRLVAMAEIDSALAQAARP